MFSVLALRSTALIIGAEVPNGVGISQPYADIYSHGGKEKIEMLRQESLTSPMLDAACSSSWSTNEMLGEPMTDSLDQTVKSLPKEMD